LVWVLLPDTDLDSRTFSPCQIASYPKRFPRRKTLKKSILN